MFEDKDALCSIRDEIREGFDLLAAAILMSAREPLTKESATRMVDALRRIG